jgi:hypothetical protein
MRSRQQFCPKNFLVDAKSSGKVLSQGGSAFR